MLITTTGYFDTGSSAFYVLLKEYNSCDAGVFEGLDNEHILLYMPNGLFDLEDKLLLGNNIHRSDEALFEFDKSLKWLYNNNFYWFGNYKKLYGNDFLEASKEFIAELTDLEVEGDWYYNYTTTRFSIKHLIRNCINKLLKRPIEGDFCKTIQFSQKREKKYSYVSEEKFYKSAKKFIDAYLKMSSVDESKNLILDHFILPHNLYRLPKYFDKNELKVINCERDPRDVYVHLMQEVTDSKMEKSIPTNVKDFVRFWQGVRSIVKSYSKEYVLDVWFEDLLLNQDKTVSEIERFCGLNSTDRINKGKFLDVEKSLNNVKIFQKDTRWQKEVEYIEENLNEYLYSF